ncbi:hypothetical protein, partial [Klebsiella pneumoniae]|uniref:hypothetical protein n=1 Tax=Klebsiella pneumoniae TaxID=573 RepID=UPI0025A124C7
FATHNLEPEAVKSRKRLFLQRASGYGMLRADLRSVAISDTKMAMVRFCKEYRKEAQEGSYEADSFVRPAHWQAVQRHFH